ncbi:MAG: 2-methylcitrate dehydratase [Rhodospirillaceae bacterium]|nr:2-methylcitrate dehydratase [Rhodospirillaceae bacterium]
MAKTNTALVEPDKLLLDVANYVLDYKVESTLALETVHLDLFDAIGCAFLALRNPECANRIGPLVDGMTAEDGVPIPGTRLKLDPMSAAFNIAMMIRFLDFNDCWFGKEGSHPSDMIGGILAVSDHVSRRHRIARLDPMSMADVLLHIVKAHEIQGRISEFNVFRTHGFDSCTLAEVACAALFTKFLGGDRDQIINAMSNAFVDGPPVRIYRQSPNTGWRKSWSAADAISRAVRVATMAMRGEMGYPNILSAPIFGFSDAYLGGNTFEFPEQFGTEIMEKISFKLWPTEFHCQTALEAAICLNPIALARLDEVEKVEIWSHRYGMNVVDKKGPLTNPADRDHCLQYVVAIGLIHGKLEYAHYEDEAAADPRIDPLREKMVVTEDPKYSAGILSAETRSSSAAIQITFRSGEQTDKVERIYPLGHSTRRLESVSKVGEKFQRNIMGCLDLKAEREIIGLFKDRDALSAMAVDDFMNLLMLKE